MLIPDGYHELPAGKIASIVTYLEMKPPPELAEEPAPDGFALVRVEKPDLAWYRMLYRRIGENWLWFSRIVMGDDQLAAILHDPLVEVYLLRHQSDDAGLLELDCRQLPEVELAFFGLVPERIGKGTGGYLIREGIRRACRHNPSRFWLHTCTLDSPQALRFYQSVGFRAYKRAVEVAADPRLAGKLPREAGSWIPLL
jgi:GNAT superfamily N-acetyltransferase